MKFAFILLTAALALALGAGAQATSLKGTLSEPGIVWISDGSTLKPKDVEMHNLHKLFDPVIVIVPLGSTVRFPNDDPFYHSIYAASGPNPFDIGFYANGPGKQVTFDKAGVDIVRCHIHANMSAIVAAVDGPSSAPPKMAFELNDVRAGSHVVHAWSEKTGERTRTVTIPEDGALTLDKAL